MPETETAPDDVADETPGETEVAPERDPKELVQIVHPDLGSTEPGTVTYEAFVTQWEPRGFELAPSPEEVAIADAQARAAAKVVEEPDDGEDKVDRTDPLAHYPGLRRDDLVDLAKANAVDDSGTMREIAERLLAAGVDAPPKTDTTPEGDQ